MSFNIGPFVGKRDAVIEAVKSQPLYGENAQGEAAKAVLIAEVSLLSAGASAYAFACGHADSSNRNVVIAVNQVVGYSNTPVPMIVPA